MIDICICTHSPFLPTLEKVFKAIIAQDIDKSQFKVLIVDNKSEPAIDLKNQPYCQLVSGGVEVQVIQESQLGIAYARAAALKASKSDTVLFVDDDNILAPDFVRNSLQILKDHPEVGCFSGKILPPAELKVPTWVEPLLSSLAMRNCGEKKIINFFRGDWHPWVPAATASMVLRKSVAEHFLNTHGKNKDFFKFGRKGHTNLTSGEDFFIALSAADVGLKCGYFPELTMFHLIRQERFSFWYIAKLMSTYATTDLMRETYLGTKPKPFTWLEVKYRLLVLDLKGKSQKARFCLFLYQFKYVLGVVIRRLMSGQKPIVNRSNS